jgi:tRNA A37 threonylcarbamoyladenosine dehydratase
MKNLDDISRHEEPWNERTLLLLGKERLAKFANSSVLVVGLGGVGAFTAEFLCRAGIGNITLCDFDIIKPSNRNRQLIALVKNENRLKTDIMSERLKQIKTDIKVNIFPISFNEENAKNILSGKYDYIVDAIDSLSSKVFLLADSVKMGYKIVSSMGSGEKCDPALVQVCDIEESYQCPLAKLVRKRLHRLGIKGGIQVVFSPEKNFSGRKKTKAGEALGSISYMPALFGIHCAATVLRNLGKF